MICPKCNLKEITSPNLTGELCTICYFNSKKEPAKVIENPKETLVALEDKTEGRIEDSPKISEEATIIQKSILVPQETIQSDTEVLEESINHQPSKSKHSIPEDGKIYCQSCIERYGTLVIATRLWSDNPPYWICDDCFEPLLNNVLGFNEGNIKAIKDSELVKDSPQLEQFYNILNIPEQLRFSKSDTVLNNRNDIFNYHATALVNYDLESIKDRIEMLQVMLFQIKVGLEPMQDYINKVKRTERDKAGLLGLDKSKESIKGPSKVKMSKLEKEAKSLGMTVEKYSEMIKSAKQAEFDKVVGK